MVDSKEKNTQDNQGQNQTSCEANTPSALDIAKYLIGLAQRDGKPITNLRLQKLLYYAWGYYWNNYKKYLFNDNIEAWKYGPVVRKVYDEYKIFDGGDIIISEDEIDDAKLKIGKDDRAFLDGFYNFTKEYSTGTLVEVSHREKPWNETFYTGKQQIDFKLLEEFFNEI